MKRWKIWTGVLVIFLSGVLIGALGTGIYVKHKIGLFRQGPRFLVMKKLVLKKLTRELDLNAEQQRKIEHIVNQATDEFVVLHRETLPKVSEILDRSLSRMKEHLSPEQQKKLDEIIENIKSRRARFFKEAACWNRTLKNSCLKSRAGLI